MTPAQALAIEAPDEAATGAGSRRTYRGRNLSEILPQIRAELGPDAVVTYQREGLVGGIRGFFAQRFIEVEAMAAPEPAAGTDDTSTIDFYDGEDAEPETAEYSISTMDAEEGEPTLATSFSETLDGVVAREPKFELDDPFLADLTPTPREEETAGEEWNSYYERPAEAVRVVQEGRVVATKPRYVASPPPVRPQQFAPRGVASAAPSIEASIGALSEPFATASPALPQAPAIGVAASPQAPVTAAQPAATALMAAPQPLAMLHSAGAELESAWFAGEAREAGEFLIGRGVSAPVAEDLIADARTHDLPFAGAGGMRDALHACLTRRLPRHRGLARGGALVAVVGGGGAGKTRCAAAIAASYRGASALDVRAIVLGRYDSGAELSSILEPHGVTVQTAERGSRAAGEIAASRAGALVVADTPTVSPGDPAGIGILGVELAALAPEEVLVALPATVNMNSARQMLTALQPLSPTGIIITHADETDQLGAAVELSLESGLPLVYVHQGLELPGALAPADPASIAERLLA
jgi:flagellar biosynthesis GTPase FlhF